MAQITEQELTTLLAEKVMGWLPSYKVGIFRDFNPLADANHALQVLEAWCAENGYASLIVNDSGMRSRWQSCFLYVHYDSILVAQTCHETSLNHAICLAVAEAVTGIKYEITK